MPKKLYDAVKQTTKRNRWRMRQRFLSAIACLIVFCITYAWILPSLAYNRPANDEIPGETIVETDDMIVSTLDTDPTDDNAWETLFADAKLTGIWRDDLLSIANSQLGYSESPRNYVIADDGMTPKGYTRYGEWFGDPYGDWDAMFVSYCLNIARVKDMPTGTDPQEWIEALDVSKSEMNEASGDTQASDRPVDRFFTSDEYTPVRGDLIFFDKAGDGKADHVGIVAELKKDENKKVTEITTIEGNSDDKVQNVTYSPDDSTILGFAALPAQPPTYTFTDDGIEVTIMLPEGTVVPRNAVVEVTPIKSNHASYDDLTKRAENAVNGSVANISLYDISFYTADGEYIPVDDRAQVSMRFSEAVVNDPSELAVLHYDANDSNPVALEGAALETMTSAKAEVTFETPGFSVFAVVQVTQNSNVVGVTGLAGKDYVIAGVDNGGAGDPAILTSDAVVGKINDNGKLKPGLIGAQYNTAELVLVGAAGFDPAKRDGVVTSVTAHGDAATAIWQFEAVTGDDNAYYIKSLKHNKYLHIETDSLTLSAEKQAIEVVDHDNRYVLRVPTNDAYTYVNLCGGQSDDEFTGMTGMTVADYGDNGNHMALWQVNSGVLTNLGGKKYVISAVNFRNTGADTSNQLRSMSSNKNGDGNTQLAGEYVTATYNDARNAVLSVNAIANNSLAWEFIAVDAAKGQYRIRSFNTGEYLQIKGNQQLTTVANQIDASIFTVENVTTHNGAGDVTNGLVCLRVDTDNGSYFVNLNANDRTSYFSSWTGGANDRGNHLILSEYTDFDGKSLAIVSVRDQDELIAVTSTVNNNTLQGTTVTWADEANLKINIPDENLQAGNILWRFIAVDSANGVYHIMASNRQYLHIAGADAYLDNQPQEITVTFHYIDNKWVVGLRAGGTTYLNESGGDNDIYGGYGTGPDGDAGSRFVLAVSTKVDSFLDPDQTDGELEDEEVIKVVDHVDANGVKVSIFDYDYRVNMDEYSHGLANRNAYNAIVATILADGKITDDEVDDLVRTNGFRFFQQAPGDEGGVPNQYHDYYLAKYGSENVNNSGNLVLGGSAWDEVSLYDAAYLNGVRQRAPFAAGEEIIPGNGILDTFKAHALSLNGAEDGPGPFWGWNAGASQNILNDDGIGTLDDGTSKNTVAVTLRDGYPYIVGNVSNNNPEGSLDYLFKEPFLEGAMNNGGGLFQVDEKGYYYYHSELNAAYYDKTKNEFVLYDHVVRPNYTLDTATDTEKGNFLPFDSLGVVGADGIVDYWTNDGNDNNDLDPDSLSNLTYQNEPNVWNEDNNEQTPIDDQHFYSPVIAGADDPLGKNVPGMALADTNLANMWFGMMIEIPFYMPKDGLVNGEEMIFSFSGDDDVLVYVDDVLLINLAGVHPAESGSINFTRGEFNHVYGYTIPDKVNGTNDNRTFADRFAAAGKAVELNENGTFEDYTFHTLKFFYIERGGNISHCAIRFNMPSLPENSLQIRKELSAAVGTGENQKFTFRVIKEEAADKAEIDLTDDLFIKPGTPYYVVKGGQVVEGKDNLTVAADGTFTLLSDEGAVFENVLGNTTGEDVPNIIVQEILGAGVNYNVQYRLSGSTTTNSLTSGGKNEVQSGTEQTVYQTQVINITNATQQIATIYNSTAGTATLSITKVVPEGVTVGENDEFHFRVKLAGILIPVGTRYHVTGTGITGENNEDIREVQEPGVITLKAGQTAEIIGITPNLTYEVSEFFTGDQNYIPGYSPTYNGTVNPMARAISGVSGILEANAKVEIEVTNNRNPYNTTIPISKKVEDSFENEYFFFNVEQGTWNAETNTWTPAENGDRPGSLISWTYDADRTKQGSVAIVFPDGADTADGTYYFRISEDPGEGNYAYDSTFYIVEVQKSGATVNITGVWKNGTVAQGDVATLEFVNRKTTSVTINKQIEGDVIDRNDQFNFTVTITDENGAPVTSAIFGDQTRFNANGVYTFTLTHNGSMVISGLPIGAIVKVEEKDRLDYKESYEVDAKYEAEYGTREGSALTTPAEGASGNAAVGGISAQNKLEIPVYTAGSVNANLLLYYNTEVNRTFLISANGNAGSTLACLANNKWNVWPCPDPAILEGFDLSAEDGINSVVFSGNGGNAPNLDYVTLNYSATGNVAMVNLLGDDAQITFINEPRTSVTIEKEVTGSTTDGEFEFTATITDAAGQPVTEAKDKDGNLIPLMAGGRYTFKLKNGESFVFNELPIGAKVQVVETEAPGHTTSYDVATRYEAEDAKFGSGLLDTVTNSSASGGEAVGNIGASATRTLTFTFNSDVAKAVVLRLCYSTATGRQFQITVNGGTPFQTATLNTGAWHNWGDGRAGIVEYPIDLAVGENTIVIGGVPTTNEETGVTTYGDAPNLDYIEIVEAGLAGRGVTVESNGYTTIHFTNEAGYELPETGGTGTLPYSLGGLLLMAVPLLYGCIRKRKREGGAET